MNRMSSALRAHADAAIQRIAIDPVVGPALSYRALAEAVRACAHGLAPRLGARAVAVDLDHGVELAVLDLALLEAGIPQLSLPRFFSEAQTAHAVRASGAEPLRTDRAGPCAGEAIALPEGTARITFTSGSTGSPKGICLSEDHMVAVANSVVAAVGAVHAGRHLAVLPPGVLLETVAGFYTTLLAGGTYVCPPQSLVGLADPFRPDFAKMAGKIAELKITSLILVPEYLAGLVAALEATGLRLPLLTLVAVGGARTPPTLLLRAFAVGLPIRQGYGLTECGSVVALQDAGDEPGSVGRLLPHMRAELAADGEVILHGPSCLGTIEQSRQPGPLATGDIGRLDNNGCLWIEGRKSNLIITTFGRNIAPEWLEEILLGQPGVAQALVYGDGLAGPEALLVASSPHADLTVAVAAANAILPAYARIVRWRPAAPFSPMNGLLTGNGRLRRDAIIATYGSGDTPFFVELERRTMFVRRRFLGIAQVQAGLSGAITQEAYVAYLAQAWHHVRHTVPLMEEAKSRLGDRPRLVAALDDYVAEETGHEEWILADIAAAGGDAEATRRSQPAPATQAMVAYAYDRIRSGNPAALFGMIYVLESVSVALAAHGASAIAERLQLPPEAFTYLTSHGALDQDHLSFLEDLVNTLDEPADREAIAAMGEEIFPLFGAIFAAIPLESQHVVA